MDVNTVTGSGGTAMPYTISYMTQDQSGNIADPVTREIYVVDTTAPTLTLVGTSPEQIEAGTSFTDQGVEWEDNYDGSGSVLASSGIVDTGTLGDYTLSYTFTDANGNSATAVERIVQVRDTIVPVITLSGSSTMSVAQGYTFTDPGATAVDSFEGDLTSAITASGSVDTSTQGTYTITYSVSDSSGNTTMQMRTVSVIVGNAPVVTLNGSGSITLELGENYTELGATATDVEDGILPVTQSGSVDTGSVGIYTVSYTATDLSGNVITVMRIVEVVDTTGPSINNPNAASISLKQGEMLNLQTVTCSDASGNCSITQTGSVDTNTLGTYTITYTATDESGNTTTSIITVTVTKKSASGGGGSSSTNYDRCDGVDTSGSIYDGKCSEDETDTTDTTDNEDTTDTTDNEDTTEDEDTDKDTTDNLQVKTTSQGVEYSVRDYTGCPVIAAIQDENYIYQSSGVFVDEGNSKYP